MRATEELGVSLCESGHVGLAALGRVADEEDLHLDDVAHSKAHSFQDVLDLVKHPDGLSLGIAKGLLGTRVSGFVDDGRDLATDEVDCDARWDSNGLGDRELEVESAWRMMSWALAAGGKRTSSSAAAIDDVFMGPRWSLGFVAKAIRMKIN